MEEIKIEEQEIEEKESTMREKIDFLYSAFKSSKKNKKTKKLKLPRKAKVSKSRAKKGWVGIMFVNENRNLSGQKAKLEGGTFKTKDDLYHVTDGKEIIFWEGKHPVVFQRHDKLNPTNLFPQPGDVNEIYGQDLVYLRMKKDNVQNKPKGKISIVMWMVILAAGYFLIKTFFPGLFGG